ncbi:Ig-like domain-containing protein [Clostridium neuense]|uniref:Ig-like domain-containing protein n=1 Tax=Clostridium neuense TaxID=1728934 RepID=A0ABW8T9C0_9CLOT
MKINKVIATAALAFAILNLNSFKIKAADVSQAVKTFSARTNVALNKTWTVKFSNEVDEKTIGDNVKVLDDDTNTYVNAAVTLNSDKKSLQIAAPSNGYDVNKNYTVTVSSKIVNLNGKNLAQDAKLDFTTAAIKSTDAIKDINTAVGTMPTLPGSINALLTDGTTKSFDITWDNLSQSDISKAGTINLSGTLKNTNYKVAVNIIVADIAFLKQFSTDLGNVEAKISDSNERNVIVVLKTAVDAKIANPSSTLNSQPAKDAWHALTTAQQNDLEGIMLSNFSLDELLEAKAML